MLSRTGMLSTSGLMCNPCSTCTIMMRFLGASNIHNVGLIAHHRIYYSTMNNTTRFPQQMTSYFSTTFKEKKEGVRFLSTPSFFLWYSSAVLTLFIVLFHIFLIIRSSCQIFHPKLMHHLQNRNKFLTHIS